MRIKQKSLTSSNSRKTSNTINYMNRRYELKRSNSIKVCGLTICNDERQEYTANVTTKIESLKRNLQIWSHRSLSFNGKMMAAKTFGVSQIVYAMQSYAISPNDLKVIEKAVYAFVNGRTNSNGPETIARKLLKAPKYEGGINGIDMESFANAICSRTYGKASNVHTELSKIQVSKISEFDDVSKITHRCINKLIKKEAHIEQNPQNCMFISGLPLAFALKSGTKAMEKAHELCMATIDDLSKAKHNGTLPRGQINKIIRALPASIKPFVTLGITFPTDICTSIPSNSQMVDITTLNSQAVQRVFMKAKQAYEPIDLSRIYKDPEMNSSHDWCSNLWLIKSPVLRALRLKILYKNVYSNERRCRFGLADSPNCQICGGVETVKHQLFECRNACDLRDLVKNTYNYEFENLESVLIPGKNAQEEIVKSVLLKCLIQIDRSAGIAEEGLKSMVTYFNTIEKIVQERHKQEYH